MRVAETQQHTLVPACRDDAVVAATTMQAEGDMAVRDDGRGRSPLSFSYHAHCRAARRNVAPQLVDYVLTYGRWIQRTGITFYFLGKRDVPAADRRAGWASRLIGTVVLVAPNGEIITVYRNRHALRAIQRKLKYRVASESRDWAEPALVTWAEPALAAMMGQIA